MTKTYRDWYEILPFALFASRTSNGSFDWANPIYFVYDIEAVLALEIEISSLRILVETKLEEAERTRPD